MKLEQALVLYGVTPPASGPPRSAAYAWLHKPVFTPAVYQRMINDAHGPAYPNGWPVDRPHGHV